MKHVWILNHYAQEPGRPGGSRHFSLAKNLKEFKWEATIIASSTEHKTGKQRLSKDETARVDYYDNVRFLWIKTSGYSGNGLGRILNMIHYTISVLKRRNINLLEKPDVIIGSSVHPFAAWAAMRLSRRFTVPFIFEVRDLWPQTLIDMGKLRERSIIALFLRRLEKTLYVRARKIVTLLPDAYDYIKRYVIEKKKIIWIPNGVDLENYPEPQESKPGKLFTFMYFGAFGLANGLDNVLRAMSVVKKINPKMPVKIRLIGDGPQKKQLKILAQRLQLDNVSFEEPVAKKDIPSIASQADAFIFNLIDTGVFKYGISSNKLFDFMAACRPILFSCKASNNPVEEAKCGITVKPSDPKKMADAIYEIFNMSDTKRLECGFAARRYVENNHNFTLLAERLAYCLKYCIET